MAEKIIIFGGSFDPVHNGHLIIARAVAEAIGGGCVLLIPTGVNPLKSARPAEPEHRLAMLRLAVQDDPLLEISDIELRRKPPSFTIDTVEELKKRGDYAGPLSLVVGTDMLEELPMWHRVEDLLRLAQLIVVSRPPCWQESTIEAVEKLRRRLGDVFSGNIDNIIASVVPAPLIDISSTDIRRRIANGLAIRYLVPDQVANFIEETGLYRR